MGKDIFNEKKKNNETTNLTKPSKTTADEYKSSRFTDKSYTEKNNEIAKMLTTEQELSKKKIDGIVEAAKFDKEFQGQKNFSDAVLSIEDLSKIEKQMGSTQEVYQNAKNIFTYGGDPRHSSPKSPVHKTILQLNRQKSIDKTDGIYITTDKQTFDNLSKQKSIFVKKGTDAGNDKSFDSTINTNKQNLSHNGRTVIELPQQTDSNRKKSSDTDQKGITCKCVIFAMTGCVYDNALLNDHNLLNSLHRKFGPEVVNKLIGLNLTSASLEILSTLSAQVTYDNVLNYHDLLSDLYQKFGTEAVDKVIELINLTDVELDSLQVLLKQITNNTYYNNVQASYDDSFSDLPLPQNLNTDIVNKPIGSLDLTFIELT